MSEQHSIKDPATGRVKSIQSGFVVSAAMDKTAVVQIERRTKHGLYKKYVRRSTRLKIHDPDNTCSVGDFVEIREGRPVSKHKSWALERVVEKATGLESAG